MNARMPVVSNRAYGRIYVSYSAGIDAWGYCERVGAMNNLESRDRVRLARLNLLRIIEQINMLYRIDTYMYILDTYMYIFGT